MRIRDFLAVVTVIGLSAAPLRLMAQTIDGTSIDEVLVTARKKGEAEAAQDVPLAITAFSGEQLEARYTRDLQSLGVAMPNVQLDDIGTIKSTANFTIRGLGVNSSIPSIEPTVGVFVDGMYLGINSGVIFDLFDIEGIEVLRGPQGLLFGRNVTGGAVLVRTRKPTNELEASVKASVTDDMDKTVAGSVSGPIGGDTLKGRLTAYVNDEDGWFTNLATGSDFGDSETRLVRPSLLWTPSETTEVVLRYEHGEFEGQGPAAQNRALHDRHSFNFAINEEGFMDGEWDQAIAEVNIDVPFGDGTITNIFGWRDYSNFGLSDIDATTALAFHAGFAVLQDQLSNELRYAGRFFDRVSLTTGLYWFAQDLTYFENRRLAGGAVNSTLGGLQDTEAYAAFSHADIDLTDSLVLSLGVRYTDEEKDAQIATFRAAPSRCDFAARTCAFDFASSDSWSDTTPKVGLQYVINPDAQIYGYWTKGFRSGGYNMRNTAPPAESFPGPFDPEEQNSFEVGAKVDWLDGRLRTNVALFHNKIDDMQRELNVPSVAAGVIQIIRNTADATIQGVDFELQAAFTRSFLATLQYGYVDGEYDEVRFDLNSDGAVNQLDEALDIPRLAPNTYGISLTHDLPIGSAGTLTSRVSFSHRDGSVYTDNNRGTLNAADMLDASLALALLDGRLRLSVYGKNLTDDVLEGNDTQLPDVAAFGGDGPGGPRPRPTFSPLLKGRVVGLELNHRL